MLPLRFQLRIPDTEMTPMMKKIFAVAMLALALTASAPVATAEVEMPECYPCGSN